MTDLLTYANSIAILLILVAGGWVKARDYFKAKAEEKSKLIEAEVQKRLNEKTLQVTSTGTTDQ